MPSTPKLDAANGHDVLSLSNEGAVEYETGEGFSSEPKFSACKPEEEGVGTSCAVHGKSASEDVPGREVGVVCMLCRLVEDRSCTLLEPNKMRSVVLFGWPGIRTASVG